MNGWAGLAAGCALLLVVTWAGYPAAMLFLGRRPKGDSPAPPSDHPSVSVVLATREPFPAIEQRIADLLRTEYPIARLEIIVAIDGAGDTYAVESIPSRGAQIRLVALGAPKGKAEALNAGAAAASGSILVFADTHQTFDPGAIPALVAALTDPGIGAASGTLMLPGQSGEGTPLSGYWAIEKRLRSAEARIHSAIGVTGAIYALRTSLWEPLPAGLLLDDLYVPMRVVLRGFRVGFVEEALAFERRHTDRALEFQRKVRTLTGNLQLLRWLPAVLNPFRNPVWAMFVCHKLLRLLTPYALLGLGVGVLGWLIGSAPSVAVGVLVGGILFLGWVALAHGAAGQRLRESVKWALAMQGAVVVASLNGLRGRWDVWRR